MNYILYDKNFITIEDLKIDMEDRGYQFGDGIYEVIGVYNGKTFKMIEHLNRLERSAKELQIDFPHDFRFLKESLEKLQSLNGLQNGMIYLQITRGAASRVHHFPGSDVPPVLIAYTREMNDNSFIQKKGVECITTEDLRWLRCDIKSLNLLGNVLAKQKAVENNSFEAILCRNEIVTEGSATNVFIVKNGVLYTHPANNYILNGITRSTVIEQCRKMNYKVEEKPFKTQDLLDADEAFLTGTLIDVVPVRKINDYNIGSGVPGSITIGIQQIFNTLIN
ncbi:D-amino-acid transaminase [Virgibacillus doumboii]|uniref:D-amino-acid transaminase n=1 Tax=Virgibacillus doumboii TaxID=2697503 RepID=UPI0013E0B28D|nr:D-amino-acid transaminase [Virgibacillus doumboii]